MPFDRTEQTKSPQVDSHRSADKIAMTANDELLKDAVSPASKCPTKAITSGISQGEHLNSAGVEYDGSINFSPQTEKSLSQRVSDGASPRIGEAWRDAAPIAGESAETSMARHDLVFGDATRNFGLEWNKTPDGEQSSTLDPKSVEQAKALRERLLAKNPNMVMLAEVRYNDGKPSTFSADSPFWQHDAKCDRIPNPDYKKFDYFDFKNPQFQEHVAEQASALTKSGAVDGVVLDWWHNGKDSEEDKASKLQLLQKVRDAIGPKALIMVNTNQQTMPEFMEQQLKNKDTGTPLVNGYYMESFNSQDKTDKEKDLSWTKQDFQQLAKTMDYAENNTREPRVNMAETWWEKGNPAERAELPKMRATTTLAMTHSDGYFLFADPDNNGATPDHSHQWYQFYNAAIGKPLGKGFPQPDGSYRREYQNGTVVSNATGDRPTTVTFPTPRIAASELTSQQKPQPKTEFTVNPLDGDIFLIPTN